MDGEVKAPGPTIKYNYLTGVHTVLSLYNFNAVLTTTFTQKKRILHLNIQQDGKFYLHYIYV